MYQHHHKWSTATGGYCTRPHWHRLLALWACCTTVMILGLPPCLSPFFFPGLCSGISSNHLLRKAEDPSPTGGKSVGTCVADTVLTYWRSLNSLISKIWLYLGSNVPSFRDKSWFATVSQNLTPPHYLGVGMWPGWATKRKPAGRNLC